MSILSDLFGSLFENKDNSSGADSFSTHPCSNCPSDCAIAGAACEVCAPYKKKLIDTIYYVDHLEEFRNQYEVTGLSGGTGAITCPYCGAQTTDHVKCEYCGSKLSEETGKIKVASASEIPNPVMQAQDIIFERYETVIKQYSGTGAKLGGSSTNGIFSELLSIFIGEVSANETENELGAKMSEAEIEEAAALYNTTVSDYLTGLDNGKYLTLAGRKALQAYAGSSSGSSYSSGTPAEAGIPGVAGIGMLTELLLREQRRRFISGHPSHRPPRNVFLDDPFIHPQRNDQFRDFRKPEAPRRAEPQRRPEAPRRVEPQRRPEAPRKAEPQNRPEAVRKPGVINQPGGLGNQKRPESQEHRRTTGEGWSTIKKARTGARPGSNFGKRPGQGTGTRGNRRGWH